MLNLETGFERRQIGNMVFEEIFEVREGSHLSLADAWGLQGIRFIKTGPVPTETHTAGELMAMGMSGVTIFVPIAETTQ